MRDKTDHDLLHEAVALGSDHGSICVTYDAHRKVMHLHQGRQRIVVEPEVWRALSGIIGRKDLGMFLARERAA